jgi:hypothetical protein
VAKFLPDRNANLPADGRFEDVTGGTEAARGTAIYDEARLHAVINMVRDAVASGQVTREAGLARLLGEVIEAVPRRDSRTLGDAEGSGLRFAQGGFDPFSGDPFAGNEGPTERERSGGPVLGTWEPNATGRWTPVDPLSLVSDPGNPAPRRNRLDFEYEDFGLPRGGYAPPRWDQFALPRDLVPPSPVPPPNPYPEPEPPRGPHNEPPSPPPNPYGAREPRENTNKPPQPPKASLPRDDGGSTGAQLPWRRPGGYRDPATPLRVGPGGRPPADALSSLGSFPSYRLRVNLGRPDPNPEVPQSHHESRFADGRRPTLGPGGRPPPSAAEAVVALLDMLISRP